MLRFFAFLCAVNAGLWHFLVAMGRREQSLLGADFLWLYWPMGVMTLVVGAYVLLRRTE
jgi:hypothetical protein